MDSYCNYQIWELEFENWSFQHFDFLDRDEKIALKLLSDKAKRAQKLETTISTLTAALQEIRSRPHHHPDNGLRMRLIADAALAQIPKEKTEP